MHRNVDKNVVLCYYMQEGSSTSVMSIIIFATLLDKLRFLCTSNLLLSLFVQGLVLQQVMVSSV